MSVASPVMRTPFQPSYMMQKGERVISNHESLQRQLFSLSQGPSSLKESRSVGVSHDEVSQEAMIRQEFGQIRRKQQQESQVVIE